MGKRPLPTIDRLRELLEIDSAGVLRWRVTYGRAKKGAPAFTYAGPYGHHAGQICGVPVTRASVVFALHNDRWAVGEVRHLDRNSTNDHPANLADAWTDPRALARPFTGRSSQFLGVRKEKSGGWVARRRVGGHLEYLGSFSSEADAARAYDAAARRDGSTFGQLLNFPIAQP